MNNHFNPKEVLEKVSQNNKLDSFIKFANDPQFVEALEQLREYYDEIGTMNTQANILNQLLEVYIQFAPVDRLSLANMVSHVNLMKQFFYNLATHKTQLEARGFLDREEQDKCIVN